MLIFAGDVFFVAAGYVAAIYTWDWLKLKWAGVDAQIKALEAKAEALKSTLSGK